jgi:hypothetical protein
VKVRALVDEKNRGVLLDIVVFVVNLLVMSRLTHYAGDVLRRAGENDAVAKVVLGVSCLAMLLLPAAAAIFKRWHFHQRMRARRSAAPSHPLGLGQSGAAGVAMGCLCNPIFYFALSIVISAGAMSLLQEFVFGKKMSHALTVTSTVLLFALCVTQTFFVYRYFAAPRKEPRSKFGRGSASELVGDVCIFVNMILFQTVWNIVVGDFPFTKVESAGALAVNFFFLTFFALLLYFPPRIFYLAEDANRPATWLTMLLANLPGIVRALLPGDTEWRSA